VRTMAGPKKEETLYKDKDTVVFTKEDDKQFNLYVTDNGDGNHDHFWFDKETGEKGIEHRGYCDECKK